MPMHLKDQENRIHEGCGFYMRDPRRVLLPGHIVLSTEDVVAFAEYVIGGGAHGWGGECPCPEAVTRAVRTIGSINLESRRVAGLPAFNRGEAAAHEGQPKTSRLLSDEQFFAMFKEKFAGWRPVPHDLAKLPEAIRKFIQALMDKMSPEDKTLAYASQVEENKALQKQLMEYRQKLLAKDKEINTLGDYVTEVERKLEGCENTIASNEKKFANMMERAVNAEAAHTREQDAHITVANELSRTVAMLEDHKQRLADTEETLKAAEDLLQESEEARERQNERFRGRRANNSAAGETEAVESDPATEEPEAPQSGTSDSDDAAVSDDDDSE